MGHSESMQRLRDASHQLYKAATQPNPLAGWARSVADLLDTEVADLTVLSPCGIAVENGSITADIDSTDYLERYQYINPLQGFWQTVPSGEVVRFDKSLIDEKFRRTEFYSRYSDYLEEGDSVCMLLSIRTARVLVHACQRRHPHAGPIDTDLLVSLRDDLLLAFEIAGAFTHASNMVGSVIRSLDQRGIGVALLSEEGRIENSNSSMDDLLRGESVLRVEQGRLTSGSSVRLQEFPNLVHRTRKSGVSGCISYSDACGEHHGSIVAYPAPMTFDWEGKRENKIVLLVTDNSRHKGALAERLRKDYGLTRAESRVASLLMDGKTSRHIATEFKVQTNSVRAHLKAIYSKTGTHSQVELLNLLQRETEHAL